MGGDGEGSQARLKGHMRPCLRKRMGEEGNKPRAPPHSSPHPTVPHPVPTMVCRTRKAADSEGETLLSQTLWILELPDTPGVLRPCCPQRRGPGRSHGPQTQRRPPLSVLASPPLKWRLLWVQASTPKDTLKVEFQYLRM